MCRPPGMCKFDSAFLAYLKTGYTTAIYRMTFKNHCSALCCLCTVCTHPPLQTGQKISEVTRPKFMRFLKDVEGPSGFMCVFLSMCTHPPPANSPTVLRNYWT